MLIEQAVFTSARSARAEGYHIVAHSPGVRPIELRELSAWGPSHDSLWDDGPLAESVNFHRLESGSYCVSRTCPGGPEYSGRGGVRVYTQCLLVSPEALARFANNPFALLEAVFAQGSLVIHDTVPLELPAVRLVGRASVFDGSLVSHLAAEPGLRTLVAAVQAAVTHGRLALPATPLATRLLSGVINCLPLDLRTQFTFTTALKPAATRRFRVNAVAADAGEQRHWAHQNDGYVFDPTTANAVKIVHPWACCVRDLLATRQFGHLEHRLRQTRGGELLKDFVLTTRSDQSLADTVLDFPPVRHADFEPHREPTAGRPRADAPHRRFAGAESGAVATQATELLDCEPARALAELCPRLAFEFQQLEDTVFEAIVGRAGAAVLLESKWRTVLEKIEPRHVTACREEFLRFTLAAREHCAAGDEVNNPRIAVAALEVMQLLLG